MEDLIKWKARKVNEQDKEYNESNYRSPISSLDNIIYFDFAYRGHLKTWEFPEPVNLDLKRSSVAVFLKENSDDPPHRVFCLKCKLKNYKGYVGVLNSNKYSSSVFFFEEDKLSVYSNYYYKRVSGPCEVHFTFSTNRSLKIEIKPWKNI